MSLSEYVNSLISETLDSANPTHQLQTVVHPEINFRYSSLNLLISRRGVGKTFTVMTGLIKLSQLPNMGGYTTFLYVSNKTNDTTVNKLINLIRLKVRIVSYSKILFVLRDLTDAKSAYEEVLNKHLEKNISRETIKDLFATLDLNQWTSETPHTIFLLDDAINVLKDSKFKELRDTLFQNRQPRITIFICAQDIFGIPTQIRRNCDTIWLFAGMTDKSMFGIMMSQLGLNGKDIWEEYSNLQFRDALIIDYTPKGVEVRTLGN
jgi:hypothetical protein